MDDKLYTANVIEYNPLPIYSSFNNSIKLKNGIIKLNDFVIYYY